MYEILGIPWYGILIICALCAAVLVLWWKYGFLKIDKDYYQDIVSIAVEKEKAHRKLCDCYKAELEATRRVNSYNEQLVGIYRAWLKDLGALGDEQ